jgi:flagellar biosynthesis/type III secretory pathway protein FliH
MPSYMHTTLERIEKYNRQKNKLKLRRLEKVSNELLHVIEEKNDIIDEQADKIDELNLIIKKYEKQYETKTKTNYENNIDNEPIHYMSKSTVKYIIIIVILSVIKNVFL